MQERQSPHGLIGTLLRLFGREARILAREPLYWFSIAIAPLGCLLFFTTMMWKGLPEKQPLGIVDEDNTAMTRSLARNLDAFQSSSIVGAYPNVTEARRAMQRGDIYGFFYIPRGTTAEASAQRLPTISYYTNFNYLVAGSLLSRDMRMMSELASGAATRQVLYAKGATEQQAMAFLQPIVIDSHATNNPWLNYNVYLSNTIVPGIFGIFIFMVTVFGIGMEIKRATAHEWLVKARGNIFVALTGKLLPQTLALSLTGAAIILFLYGFMHFPCNCGIATMLLVMLLFVLACQGLGVLMFTLVPTLRLGMSFASLWGVVSFSICGMSFPVMAMHPVLQGLSWLFPLRHYFLLYVNCALDGYELANALPFVAALLGFAILPLLCALPLKKLLLTVKYIP